MTQWPGPVMIWSPTRRQRGGSTFRRTIRGEGKIAEHGGGDQQDRNVPILVVLPGLRHGSINALVETTQIAPSILKLLGLAPRALEAVRIEHARALPGI